LPRNEHALVIPVEHLMAGLREIEARSLKLNHQSPTFGKSRVAAKPLFGNRLE